MSKKLYCLVIIFTKIGAVTSVFTFITNHPRWRTYTMHIIFNSLEEISQDQPFLQWVYERLSVVSEFIWIDQISHHINKLCFLQHDSSAVHCRLHHPTLRCLKVYWCHTHLKWRIPMTRVPDVIGTHMFLVWGNVAARTMIVLASVPKAAKEDCFRYYGTKQPFVKALSMFDLPSASWPEPQPLRPTPYRLPWRIPTRCPQRCRHPLGP